MFICNNGGKQSENAVHTTKHRRWIWIFYYHNQSEESVQREHEPETLANGKSMSWLSDIDNVQQ